MKKIVIKNFQSHKRTVLELSPTITAIIGKSNQGKSSVVRAVEWVRSNKPTGKAFIRNGTDTTKVIIDGVTHTRTKSTNSYTLNGTTYKALRGAVPDEVVEELNISDINIQHQGDSVFLLNDSPGKVAQRLSELIDLESANSTLKVIAAKKRKVNVAIEAHKKNVEDLKAQIEGLRHIDDADADLRILEQKQARIDDLRQKHTELLKLYENAAATKIRLSKLPSTQLLKPAQKLLDRLLKYDKKQRAVASLHELCDDVEYYQVMASIDVQHLLDKANTLKDKLKASGRLAEVISAVERREKKVQRTKNKEEALIAKKKELLKGKCPLCGK